MKRLALALLATTLIACAGDSNLGNNTNNTNGTTGDNNTGGECTDGDGDGFDGRGAGCPAGTDCDDTNAQVHPAAMEQCMDRTDNDCDGQIDEDCGGGMDCIDNDNDRYGQGTGCFGPDCDDTNAAINPSGMEVCGNGIDEDCKNGDLVCPENCTDADGDGYGAAGSTDCTDDDGNVLTEVDCDDTNPDINPSATEICDGVDNDCDTEEDECALEGQSCTGPGGQCQGGAGAQCENQDDCVGQFLRCDTNEDPKVCKYAEGGQCSSPDDCIDGLFCEDNLCTGNFCAGDPCTGNGQYDVCDRDAGACVECPHFDADEATRNAACTESGEVCVTGGWCSLEEVIDRQSGLNLDISTEEELFWVNVWMADCWLYIRPNGEKDVCFAFETGSDIQTITKDRAKTAFVDGHIDNEIFMDEKEALDDAWGVGFFDAEEVDWNVDIEPNTLNEVCLWYEPGGFLGGEALVVDKCENFTP